MQVEGIKRITAPNAGPGIFAETVDLELLGRAKGHWSWVRLFFLSVCYFVFRMRSGDPQSVS